MIIQPQLAGFRGRLFSYLVNPATGEIWHRTANHNVITRLGLVRGLRGRFVATAFCTQCAVGTGVTTPATTDTGLTTLTLMKDITSQIDTFETGDTPYRILHTQFDTDEANANLTEAGLFDSDDVIFNHALFGRGTVTGATQADPVVITSVGHGMSSGTRVIFASVGGMTQLNGNRYYISSLTADTFSLYNDAGLTDTLDGSGFSAFTSGGTWTIDIPKTSSNILVVRFEIQYENA